MTKQPMTRRLFIAAATGMAAASTLDSARAAAKLDRQDPIAVALGYVDSAADVDTKRFPSFVRGSNCENCLQLQGRSGDALRPCSLFPDKLVAAVGWCVRWTPEM